MPPASETPVTVAVEEGPGVTVATVVVELLQVPPGVALLKVIVEPGHTVVVPKIGVPLQGIHLYTWSLAGAVKNASVLNVVEEGVGAALTLLSVCQSAVLLAIPIVAPSAGPIKDVETP